MEASYRRHVLNFKTPGGTSRGVLRTKESWFIVLRDSDKIGIGECGLLRGLSVDDRPDYEAKLKWVCDHIHLGEGVLYHSLLEYPSIQMGLETAFLSLKSESPFELFPSQFTSGADTIPINGLIWMGDRDYMHDQISERIEQGFSCIKMKIGAIDFNAEIELLRGIRNEFSEEAIEIRVDANGAFVPGNALEKLKRLSDLKIHSIEQPIKPRQWDEMAALCEETPIPIALDEELIGLFSSEEKRDLLQQVKPQYIILKPSFIGGFKGSDEWIDLAAQNDAGWWITSALESNVGLNAISQYTYTKNSKLPQGLGTGSLFTNNFPSPLLVKQGTLSLNSSTEWDLSQIDVTI